MELSGVYLQNKATKEEKKDFSIKFHETLAKILSYQMGIEKSKIQIIEKEE